MDKTSESQRGDKNMKTVPGMLPTAAMVTIFVFLKKTTTIQQQKITYKKMKTLGDHQGLTFCI